MKKWALAILVYGLAACAASAHRHAVVAQAPLPAKHGKLQVIGTHLCDQNGKPVALLQGKTALVEGRR